jgi:hypothetical protein
MGSAGAVGVITSFFIYFGFCGSLLFFRNYPDDDAALIQLNPSVENMSFSVQENYITSNKLN